MEELTRGITKDQVSEGYNGRGTKPLMSTRLLDIPYFLELSGVSISYRAAL